MPLLVVAAHSARLLAELARAEGHEVIALDLFGDADTRAASRRWSSIAAARHSMKIDAPACLAALRAAAEAGAAGWIAGAGFEAHAELLEEGARLLPLIGMPAAALRPVRDPRLFFARLDALGIGFPPVAWSAPGEPSGWLLKDAHGSGGWHIRQAAGAEASASHYWQREAAGLPMSTSFIANGREALVLGHNRLIVRALGARPHVYCGAIGPLALPDAVAAELGRIVQALTAEFALRGLCSLDLLLDGERIAVLEVNARPSASHALYRHRLPLIAAHIAACRDAVLPPGISADGTVHAHRIVYARRAFELHDSGAAWLHGSPDVHDLPSPASRFEAGDPVFSLSASALDHDTLIDHLKQRRDALLTLLETSP
jgi:uncharacterized protein